MPASTASAAALPAARTRPQAIEDRTSLFIAASDLQPHAEEIGGAVEFALDRPACDLTFGEFQFVVGQVLDGECGRQVVRERVRRIEIEPELGEGEDVQVPVAADAEQVLADI